MVLIECNPKFASFPLTLVNMGTTLQERLEDALLARGEELGKTLTPNWLAVQVGRSRTAIYKWFNGATQTLDGDNLLKAAGVLNVNAEWLANGKGPMKGGKSNRVLPPEIEAFENDLLDAWANNSINKESLDALGTLLRSLKSGQPKSMRGTPEQEEAQRAASNRLADKLKASNSQPVQDKDADPDLN